MITFLSESCIKRKFGSNKLLSLRQFVLDHINRENEDSSKLNIKLNLTLPQKKAELWISNALGGNYVGQGNAPTDVVYNGISIDVKCLKPKSFCDLISLSRNTGKNKINYLSSMLKRKYDRIKTQYEVNELMYAFLITTNEKVSLSIATIDENFKLETSIRKRARTNIYIKGLVDELEGVCKIDEYYRNISLKLNTKCIPSIDLWTLESDDKVENSIKHSALDLNFILNSL